MRRSRTKSGGLKQSNRGASVVEYGILMSLVAVAAITSVSSFGFDVSSLFGSGSTAVSDARSQALAGLGRAGPTTSGEEEEAGGGLELIYVGSAITLPIATALDGTTVDWGDGSTTTLGAGSLRDVTHAYGGSGTYTVRIVGDVPHIQLRSGVTEVVSWGDVQLASLEGAFANAGDLARLPSSLPPTVTTLEGAFANLSQAVSGPSEWDTSNVESLRAVFTYATAIPDVTGWNVGNVVVFFEAFDSSNFDQDIGGWDVSSADTLSFMFNNTPFNQDISGWDVSSVRSFDYTFGSSDFDQDIGGWNVSSATSMMGMFYFNRDFNQDLSSWCVASFEYGQPASFDSRAFGWTLPDSRPNWGAPC